jgi:hypothetical protein
MTTPKLLSKGCKKNPKVRFRADPKTLKVKEGPTAVYAKMVHKGGPVTKDLRVFGAALIFATILSVLLRSKKRSNIEQVLSVSGFSWG